MTDITENTPTTPANPAAPAAAPAPAPAPAAPPAVPVATQIPAQPVQPPAPAGDTSPAPPAGNKDGGKTAGDAAPATFGEAVTYQPTGDANLDLALAFVGKHGLAPEHPAMVAATQGDFGQIKALLAEKGVPGFEAYVALAEKGYQDVLAREAEKVAAVQQIVTQAAGDEAAWGATLAWASANAEPDEKEAVNAALAQGGVVAEAVAAFLVNQYRAATGTTYAPAAPAVKQEAGRGAGGASSGALSPADYGKAVMELRRTKGAYFEESAEYRQLQARRAAWRG